MRGLVVPKEWYWFLFWFSGFTAISIFSAFVYPVIFEGMRVYTPKGGIDEQYLSRGILSLSSSNFAQAAFLFLCWANITFFSTSNSRAILNIIENSYLVSGLIVCFFSFYQLISLITGIYYPSIYILNNTTYGIATDATLGFMPRINSTFTEPSFYAMFMGGFVSWAYIKFISEPDARNVICYALLLLISIICLMLSASSSGFLALFVFFSIHAAWSLIRPRSSIKRMRIWSVILTATGTLTLAYIAVSGVDAIFDAVLFEKGSSDSSLHRMAADTFALSVLRQTNFLGAGLGSNRPSSFFAFLVSNIGILGFLLAFIAVCVLATMGIKSSMQISGASKSIASIQASGWALFTMLVAKILAGQ